MDGTPAARGCKVSTYPKAIYARTAACSECLECAAIHWARLADVPRGAAGPRLGPAPGKALWPIVDLDAWCGRFLPRGPAGSV